MVNPNYFIALTLCLILFFTSVKYFNRINSIAKKRYFFAITVILAIVSLSIPIAYLSDFIGENPVYAQFRTLSYAELLVSLVAPFMGVIFAKVLSDSIKKPTKACIYLFGLLIALAYVSLPFIKPIIRPLSQNVGNQWIEGIALQTTHSTCGPASLATIMARNGDKETEAHIARQAFTSSSGTENWYLARYAYQQGYQYRFFREPDLAKVPTPSIIGVKLGRAGHFITLLSSDNGDYIIADSLSGLYHLTFDEFNKKYRYNGFVLYLNKAD